MPLPQQVIDRLTREPPKTPGWSVGIILFSVTLVVIAFGVYFGITLAYEPYVESQISSVNNQVSSIAASVSSADQTNLIAFYSEIANVRSALTNHVYLSRFITWLEESTEANVYFTSLSFSSGNTVGLTGIAANESDVNQQLAIFEASPEISQATISNVSFLASNGKWQFTISLKMEPSLFLAAASSSTTP
jgi:Fimbrial assembly protein (PilN)